MPLDFVVGGMPRGGTTVAAKFMSLHSDMFCYAGETHLVPLMHSMFSHFSCRPEKIDLVARYLQQQFMTAMVEMPRFSVSQGAHPGNLVFDEKSVNFLMEEVRSHLAAGLCGSDLYRALLNTLGSLISKVDQRPIIGEKTPNNIFAMADFGHSASSRNVVVVREPLGVLRSMKARVDRGDPYSGSFDGALIENIGMYIEYAAAASRVISSAQRSVLVRYEDIAQDPVEVLCRMYSEFGLIPEDKVIEFVEGKFNKEIADRAPMNYRRLRLLGGCGGLSPADVWLTCSLTRSLRGAFGYSDEAMSELGYTCPQEWPGTELPVHVTPLYGFHRTDENSAVWIKRKAGLLVFMGRSGVYEVVLRLEGFFPEQVQGAVGISVLVNGSPYAVYEVEPHGQCVRVAVELQAEEAVPMGMSGSYAIIELAASISFCELSHMPVGSDAVERSFQLSASSVRRKATNWWTKVLHRSGGGC